MDRSILMLEVLHLDDDFVAVHKPSGLLVHRLRTGDPEPAALQLVRDRLGQHVYPVHRLDRATSGVLLFARTPTAASTFAEQLRGHRVTKRYDAIVRGWPAAERGCVDSPLRDEIDGTLRSASTTYERVAVTEQPIAVGRYGTARYAHLRLWPTTGRTHQLRRHMAHLRHPIVGDVRHGDGHHNRAMREHFDAHRLLLFATSLAFEHPTTGARVHIVAPPCAWTVRLFERLGFTPPGANEDPGV